MKGEVKVFKRQSQKEKGNGPHGQVPRNPGLVIKGKVGKGHQVCSRCGRKGHSVEQCWQVPKSSSAGSSSDHQKQVCNIAAQSADHSVAIMPTDQLRGLQDLRPLHQQHLHNQPYYSQPASSSAVSSIFASAQGQGLSGHHLIINHVTSGVSEEHITDVNFSNPIYDISPSLPQECQEPWAALIDTRTVASIAPQSLVPHIPIKEKSETLANANGGNIKVLGVKHVTFITGKVIIMWTSSLSKTSRIQSLV